MNTTERRGIANTNSKVNSIAKLQHSEPTVTLLGRIAGGLAGNVGLIGGGRKKDLHFTLITEDLYTGMFGFDGQPGIDPKIEPSIIQAGVDSVFQLAGIIRVAGLIKSKTNYYRNTLPADILINIKMDPPQGTTSSVFASKIIAEGCGFADYKNDYSVPSGIIGETMVKGKYNSSSYIAGLLNSVMGYVPKIDTPGYQAPGWESLIPSKYFKDALCN